MKGEKKTFRFPGRDTALPSKAARVRAEERRRGDEDGDVRPPTTTTTTWSTGGGWRQEAELAFIFAGGCRGRLRHGASLPRWGQQQAQNQPGGENELKAS